ncbi:hypothetical protein NA56DRAFT_707411 [Hyaloscypha hepaticicola]|uniref:Uncharacterized protein n=1 Tax=Hyaloscypha hepaticicola TaxID=2082293 RepID=A0A2J6PUG2_9HELO|nr:hypothetical protein NA56DRAFT_707411 [Hyaloscypha hepaticicola]
MAGSIVVGDVDSRGVVKYLGKFSVSVDGQVKAKMMRAAAVGVPLRLLWLPLAGITTSSGARVSVAAAAAARHILSMQVQHSGSSLYILPRLINPVCALYTYDLVQVSAPILSGI